MGLGEIRVKLYGLFQAFDRLVQLALAPEQVAEINPDGIVLGPQCAGRLEGTDPQAVLGPEVLQAEVEGQLEIGRVFGAGRCQPRCRVQPVAFHELRQHTQRRHGRAGGISVRRQFLDRIAVAPHGRVAKAICPRTGVGSTRDFQQPISQARLRFVQGPVVHRGDQFGLHRGCRDSPGRRGRVEGRQVQIALRERLAVGRRRRFSH